MRKYFIITYGCQMNVHESEKIAGILRAKGFVECSDKLEADIIVFNTCCIRENAEQHAYGNIGALKQIKKAKPSLIVAVGGCMTQQPDAAEKLRKTFPFVDIVFGTHNLSLLGDLIDKRQKTRKRVVEILNDGSVQEGDPVFRDSYPNAWVNVMYGCNNFCSYCIVPYVRGRERSRNPQAVYEEVKGLIADGYKEITLLGQNVNSYGKDLEDKTDFAELIEMICQIPGKYRLRFMSNHPKDFNEKLVDVIAKYPNICKCVHLPLQSGSDRILKLMNRRYTSSNYLDKIKKLRDIIPECAVTSDVMIGFPTETEEDFQQTLEVVKAAGYSGAFTFVYSRRKGTVADAMDGHVDEATKKDRIMRLVDLQNAINRQQSEKYIGCEIEILCEDYDQKKNLYLGRDEFGKMGYFASEQNLIGKFVSILVTDNGGMSLYGTVTKVED